MRGLLVFLLVPILVAACSDSGDDANGCLNGYMLFTFVE